MTSWFRIDSNYILTTWIELYKATRRSAKWAGLVLLFLIFSAWAVSIQGSYRYIGKDYNITLSSGILSYSRIYGTNASWDRSLDVPSAYNILVEIKGTMDWQEKIGLIGFRQVADRIIQFRAPLDYGKWCEFWLPIWPLFLCIAFPTSLVWKLRSRYQPGHCQSCGYNLFSNTSGICPECGTPIPKETREKLKGETQP